MSEVKSLIVALVGAVVIGVGCETIWPGFVGILIAGLSSMVWGRFWGGVTDV